MRLRVAILVLAVAAAGCGGSKDVAKSARPCLARLGQYVHHVPRKLPTQTAPLLPVGDPDFRPTAGATSQLMPWTKDVQEYGEVLYPHDQPGANSLQVLIFRSDELPKKIVAQARSSTFVGGFLVPGRKTTRIGRAVLLWSSAPTARQRAGAADCLS